MTDWNQVRADEKARYLAANLYLGDAEERWHAYENKILDMFGPPRLRLCVGDGRENRLEVAWEARDRHNTWVTTRSKAPRSKHANGPERSSQ